MLPILESLREGAPVAAISLRPVWACAVTWLGKDVENRNYWPFGYHGPLVIHASAREPVRQELEEALRLAREDEMPETFLDLLNPDDYVADLLPRGSIVAVANLADVFDADADIPDGHFALASPWAEEDARYWLYFDKVFPVKPVPYKGRVGLFKIEYNVAKSLVPFSFDGAEKD